jgi:hypothetical protein
VSLVLDSSSNWTNFLSVILHFLLQPDGRERQSISAPKGVRFIKATISDPYVLVHRDDGRLALFVGDTIRGKFEEVAIPLDKGVTVVASSIYSDTSGVFTTLAPTSVINPLSGDSAPGTTGASSQEAGDAMDDDHDEDLYGKAEPKPSAVEVPPPAVEAEDVKLETVASLESVMDTGKGKQWLCLCLSDGRLEVRRVLFFCSALLYPIRFLSFSDHRLHC